MGAKRVDGPLQGESGKTVGPLNCPSDDCDRTVADLFEAQRASEDNLVRCAHALGMLVDAFDSDRGQSKLSPRSRQRAIARYLEEARAALAERQQCAVALARALEGTDSPGIRNPAPRGDETEVPCGCRGCGFCGAAEPCGTPALFIRRGVNLCGDCWANAEEASGEPKPRNDCPNGWGGADA